MSLKLFMTTTDGNMIKTLSYYKTIRGKHVRNLIVTALYNSWILSGESFNIICAEKIRLGPLFSKRSDPKEFLTLMVTNV